MVQEKDTSLNSIMVKKQKEHKVNVIMSCIRLSMRQIHKKWLLYFINKVILWLLAKEQLSFFFFNFIIEQMYGASFIFYRLILPQD